MNNSKGKKDKVSNQCTKYVINEINFSIKKNSLVNVVMLKDAGNNIKILILL